MLSRVRVSLRPKEQPALASARGCVLDITHDPNRMMIDLRIPTMPERSTPGFHRPVSGDWEGHHGAMVFRRLCVVMSHDRRAREHICWVITTGACLRRQVLSTLGRNTLALTCVPNS